MHLPFGYIYIYIYVIIIIIYVHTTQLTVTRLLVLSHVPDLSECLVSSECRDMCTRVLSHVPDLSECLVSSECRDVCTRVLSHVPDLSECLVSSECRDMCTRVLSAIPASSRPPASTHVWCRPATTHHPGKVIMCQHLRLTHAPLSFSNVVLYCGRWPV